MVVYFLVFFCLRKCVLGIRCRFVRKCPLVCGYVMMYFEVKESFGGINVDGTANVGCGGFWREDLPSLLGL